MIRFARPDQLAAFIVAMFVALAPRASAQDRHGQIPDPLNLAEFKQLLDRYVQPAKEQASDIERLHDAYRERCHALRENEITQFLKKKQELWNGGRPRFAHTDEYARIRECSTGKYMLELDPIIIVDISSLVNDLNLSPDDQNRVDSALAAYEQRLTELMKDLAASSIRNRRDIAAAGLKAGAGSMSMEDRKNDPERAKALDAAVREATARAQEPFKVKCDKLSAFNEAARKSLASQLPDAYKQLLRNQYLTAAYPRLTFGSVMRPVEEMLYTDQLFRKALRSKTMAKPELGQIQAAYEQWLLADEALVEQGIKDFRALDAETDPSTFDRQREHQRRKLGNELRLKRLELGSHSLKSVSALLDNPKLKSLFERDPAREGSMLISDRRIDQMVDDPSNTTLAELDPSYGIREQALSLPLSWADLTKSIEPLGLDDAQKALVQTTHSDYLNRCDEAVKPVLAKMVASVGTLYERDPETGNPIPHFDRICDYMAMKQDLHARMTEADRAFFENLEATLGERYATAVQLAHLERVLNRSTRRGFGYAGGANTVAAVPVNIAELLRASGLAPQDLARVHEAIHDQVDPLIAALLDSYTTSQDLERDLNDNQAEFMANAKPEEIKTGYYKLDPEFARKNSEAREAIRVRQQENDRRHTEAIQRVWLAALDQMLEIQRAAMQMDYDEKAFPTLFEDDCSALPYIKRALKLADVSDEQRAKLQALASATREAHVQLFRKLIPLSNNAAARTGPGPNDAGRDRPQFAEARMKAVLDNDDLNQQAIRELRRILTEAQAAQVKGLSKYEQDAAEVSRNRKKYGL